MRYMIKNACLVLCITIVGLSIGYPQTDSIRLSYADFLQNIVMYHPIAKQAELQLDLADAEWLAAKGNLDPKLTAGWSQKDFDDKLYYQIYQGKLTIPTQLGIDIVSGYENTDGIFLNPENTTDPHGLWNLGVEVDVLQGFLVNERRTAIQQARVFRQMAENERLILLNELIFDASTAYLEWLQYFYFQEVLAENIEIADIYFRNTRESFINGEKSAIDTLEAYILYQDAVNMSQKNEVSLAKVQQQLENFLWFNNLPLILERNTQPATVEQDIFQPMITLDVTNLINNHPAILAYTNKLTYFQIEQRLKREKLKPKLKVKYNPLLATSPESVQPNFSPSNYTWGFDFSFPLLLRSERANIQKGNIKLETIELDIENKRNELSNKLEGSLLQQQVLRDQLAVLRQNVEGYRMLMEGESEKFRFGESSVFLLNKRQEKYINGQLKLIELEVKVQQERLNFLYYANRLSGQ